jgi:hypothetical protein
MIEAGLNPDLVSSEVLFTGAIVEYTFVDAEDRRLYRFGLVNGKSDTFVQVRELDDMPHDPELYDSPVEAMSEIAKAVQAFRNRL